MTYRSSDLAAFVTSESRLSFGAVQNTLRLLSQDCTLPFIARYRKEATGGLDEVAIGQIIALKDHFETVDKRKKFILSVLKKQANLTPELRTKIQNAQELSVLEDLYLPYKSTRKTKAAIARAYGLEPLAKILLAQPDGSPKAIAGQYLTKEIESVDLALEGSRHIIAQWISERPAIRNKIRQQLDRFARIETKVVKDKATDEKAQKYRDYFEWSESLHRSPSHRLLAILRAEKEGYVKVKLTIDDEIAVEKINRIVLKKRNQCAQQVQLAIVDAYKRLLFPSLAKETLTKAKKEADKTAIAVFDNNLKQLLLGAPLGEKRILAVDPGFRTGCKLVCLDAQGQLLHNETIYPHPPKNDEIGAIKKIAYLTNAYKIEAIAIGDGTASRETERLIKKVYLKNNVDVYTVSEAGASIYSASKIARDEFPDYDVTVRGAISIGRRLQDPLAELVKIDAKSIGVGQYQHDVDESALQKSLNLTVQQCVNAVGVNLNTASGPLLSYVSGIGPKLAKNIIRFREDNGPFASRKALQNVPRLGEKAYEQAAGFLRIKGAANPLDDSSVHPESYSLVTQIAKDHNVFVSQLIGNKTILHEIDLQVYSSDSVGLVTLKDIVSELEKPGLDIRQKASVFTFDQNIRTIEDLQSGQLLPGIVNNVTNFGAFVDIGIKESGLIHISNLADGFVSDVNKHIRLQQQLIVKVITVDVVRKRIQLKLEK